MTVHRRQKPTHLGWLNIEPITSFVLLGNPHWLFNLCSLKEKSLMSTVQSLKYVFPIVLPKHRPLSLIIREMLKIANLHLKLKLFRLQTNGKCVKSCE
jgi:hypothetical protein